MKRFQVIRDNVCVDVLAFDDAAQLDGNAIMVPGEPVFPAPAGATFMQQDGAGPNWTLTGGVLVEPVRVEPTRTKDELVEFANRFQWNLACGGHNVTINGNTYLFSTDAISIAMMSAKSARLLRDGAPATVEWQLDTGFVTLTAADLVATGTQIDDWRQTTFDALKPVLDAINAGTITSVAQIKAASWPAS